MKACWRKAGCTRNCITLSFNSVFHSGRRKVVLAGCGEFFRIGGERYSRLILILDKEGRQDQIIKSHLTRNTVNSFTGNIISEERSAGRSRFLFHDKCARIKPVIITVQPSGFTATKACTQAAIPAAWRLQASGSRCKSIGTPRGTVEV